MKYRYRMIDERMGTPSIPEYRIEYENGMIAICYNRADAETVVDALNEKEEQNDN